MAVVETGTQNLKRTASLPDDIAFTACGWATLDSKTGFQCVFSLDDGVNWASLGYEASPSAAVIMTGGATGGGRGVLIDPTAGDPFFWAYAASGVSNATNIGYMRLATQNTLTSASYTGGDRTTMTPTGLYIGADGFGSPFSGRLWNVKVWDRALSAAELLIESYYRRVMFPSSIHLQWEMDRHDQVFDVSGNGKSPTITGTLATADGWFGLWKPRRRTLMAPPQPATQIEFLGSFGRRRTRYAI